MHALSSGPENRAAKKARYERNFHPDHGGTGPVDLPEPEKGEIDGSGGAMPPGYVPVIVIVHLGSPVSFGK